MFRRSSTRGGGGGGGGQREEAPLKGEDSCYGVRSLSSSMSSWDDDTSSPVPFDMDSGEPSAVLEEGEMGDDNQQEASFSPTVSPISIVPARESIKGDIEPTKSYGSNETLTPMRISTVLPVQPNQEEYISRLSLAELPTIPHRHMNDDLSPPSSPASFTYSCIASLSSISRTSSPIGYRPLVGLMGDDLVLPTLSLPSSSLHVSLPKWQGEIGGEVVKIGLIGQSESCGELLRGLQGEGRVLVGLDVGVGVVKGDKVFAVIYSATSVEQMQRRINEGYAAFDELINPSVRSEKEEEIRKLATAYAGKSDWIHAVLVVDGDDTTFQTLAGIVPIITALPTNVPTLNLSAESRAPTPSPPKLGDEPTPMPSVSRAESYFALPSPSNLSLLQQALDMGQRITEASITEYISWRGTDRTPLHSSFTSSTSPSTSSYGAHQPMPTVARAQGGAQWEAEVSRREANNRRLKHRRRPSVRDEYYLDKRRRRSCGPNLFPRGQGKQRFISSVGLRDSVFGLWAYVKDVSGWKWGLAAAAVIFVGIGWDMLKLR